MEQQLHQSVTKSKSYPWVLEMSVGPTPRELAHWVCKEMQTMEKQAEYTIPQLLSVAAKRTIKGGAGLGLKVNQAWIWVNLSFDHQPQSCLAREELSQSNRKQL